MGVPRSVAPHPKERVGVEPTSEESRCFTANSSTDCCLLPFFSFVLVFDLKKQSSSNDLHPSSYQMQDDSVGMITRTSCCTVRYTLSRRAVPRCSNLCMPHVVVCGRTAAVVSSFFTVDHVQYKYTQYVFFYLARCNSGKTTAEQANASVQLRYSPRTVLEA